MTVVPACEMCGSSELHHFRGYDAMRRVTSDCRPWPAGGRLCVCTNCGTAQRIADAAWLGEIAAIYDNYGVYHQSGGAEQLVFNAGAGVARSSRIAGRLLASARLPEQGDILDIGCGNGAFLAAFATLRPDWGLYGAELDDRNRSALERIPGFRKLHVGDARRISQRFDVVILIHTLEHIVEPLNMLEMVGKELLKPGGHLVIEVPNHWTNPFDLLIADHKTHFAPLTLSCALRRAGFVPSLLDDACVAKEIMAVALQTDEAPTPTQPAVAASAVAIVSDALNWLDAVVASARQAAQTPVGLFGTSIAAGWLAGELGDRIAFFVDEDLSRIGRSYLDRPILAPASVPSGSNVLVPLAGPAAQSVASRLGTTERQYLPLPDGKALVAAIRDH